jgi:acetyltransferase-like isoleucine patch superfamily enzyme
LAELEYAKSKSLEIALEKKTRRLARNPLRRLKSHKSSPSPFMCENPKYANYSVGEFSYGEPTILSWGEKATLTIGNFCSIAGGVTILLGGEHRPDWVTTFPFNKFFEEFQAITGHPATKGDVIIGNDVWIGMNVLILSGVTIGDGSVVGANSVIARDVAPYSIVAGNPAKPVRKRFDQATIDKLLKIKWWNWDIQRIKENVPLMLSNKVKEFAETNTVGITPNLPSA